MVTTASNIVMAHMYSPMNTCAHFVKFTGKAKTSQWICPIQTGISKIIQRTSTCSGRCGGFPVDHVECGARGMEKAGMELTGLRRYKLHNIKFPGQEEADAKLHQI